MKFAQKKLKVFLITLVIMIAIMLEFGILCGFRFTDSSTVENGMTYAIRATNIAKDLGWNYIVMSALALLGSFLWSFYMGYNRNPWGLAALVLVSLSPFIGLVTMYNVFYGWGTGHLAPFMYIVGLTSAAQWAQLIFFGAVTVLYPVFWFFGKGMQHIIDSR